MTYTDHKITLDIHSTVSAVALSVKKGDTGRRLLIHLSENGYPYHISDDCYAVFTARKPDSNVVFNDCSIEDCVVIYEFTEQTVAVEGMLDCEIKIYGSNGKQLTSASFNIIVEGTVYDEGTEIESTSEFNALSALVAEVLTLREELGKLSPKNIGEVDLLADNWVGDTSPYSQVVEIEGVTEYTMINLQPSVEQLTSFHDKDLALVAENEDGVVTVYAIGDKPANDYTIQVTLTEVNV